MGRTSVVEKVRENGSHLRFVRTSSGSCGGCGGEYVGEPRRGRVWRRGEG